VHKVNTAPGTYRGHGMANSSAQVITFTVFRQTPKKVWEKGKDSMTGRQNFSTDGAEL